jgi:hypothetical protein
MSNVNRILTFIIGLIVLVILLLFINSRLNSRNNAQTGKVTPTPTKTEEKKGFDFFGLFKKDPTVTPTVTKNPLAGKNRDKDSDYNDGASITGTQDGQSSGNSGVSGSSNDSQTGTGGNDINEIPRTGAPTLLIPFALASMGAGTLLRKSKK